MDSCQAIDGGPAVFSLVPVIADEQRDDDSRPGACRGTPLLFFDARLKAHGRL
jgi:hypothetical protein